VLLVVAFAAAVVLAVVGAVQHRAIFLVAAATFALLPVAYLVAAAVRSTRAGTRVAEVAAAVVLVGALAGAAVVAIGGCEQRLGPAADLAGCDLGDAVLAAEDLSGADLTGADLSGADLRRATLDGANLTSADLTGASLEDASLAGAVLAEARLESAELAGADLSGADLSGAGLASLDFSAATLTDVTLAGADLSAADLSGARLSGVDLQGAVAAGANLAGADLRGADLSGAALGQANLDLADLRDAALAGADLGGASLVEAPLDGADLTDATLAGAVVSDTTLIGATGVTDEALASAFSVDVDDLGRTMIDRNVRLDRREDVLAAAGGACGGNAVDGAGSYARGAFNPMVILDGAGGAQPGLTDQAPVLGWEPTGTRFVNLVACVDHEATVTVESCPYVLEDGGIATILRQRYERRVVVVDPSTGSLLLDETVQGSTPQACPPTHLFFGGSRTDTFEGSHVDFNAIQRDLVSFVRGRG
jgi:uncharacterized protein YjbI with pentapeptide repeats